jgi:hypothetical protein
MFVFFVFRKSCLIKSCSFSEDLPKYKFHGPTQIGETFASTSYIWTPVTFERSQLRAALKTMASRWPSMA